MPGARNIIIVFRDTVAHCDPKGKNPPAREVGKNLTEKPAYVHKQEQWLSGGVEEPMDVTIV